MSDQKPPGSNSGDIHVGGSVTSGGGDVVIGHGNIVKKAILQGDLSTIDVAALKSQLEELYDALDTVGLPSAQKRAVQSDTNEAIKTISEPDPQADAIVDRLQAVGQTLQQAEVTVQQGSQLATTLGNIARTVGPLVAGGAKLVAAWFGIPLPF